MDTRSLLGNRLPPTSTINGSTAWLKVAVSTGHTCTNFEKKTKSKNDFRCVVNVPSQRVLAHATFIWLPRNVATLLNLCDTLGEVHLLAPLFAFSCTSEMVCALMNLSELVANVILWVFRLRCFGEIASTERVSTDFVGDFICFVSAHFQCANVRLTVVCLHRLLVKR